jgi:hypothetical protein
MIATVAPAYTPPHTVTTMDKNRKRKPDRVRLQETKNLTVLGDSPDIYDVPDSPPCVKRAKNGSRRPWDLSQNTPEDTIRVSTPDRLRSQITGMNRLYLQRSALDRASNPP